jgi:hypothetical protein
MSRVGQPRNNRRPQARHTHVGGLIGDRHDKQAVAVGRNKYNLRPGPPAGAEGLTGAQRAHPYCGCSVAQCIAPAPSVAPRHRNDAIGSRPKGRLKIDPCLSTNPFRTAQELVVFRLLTNEERARLGAGHQRPITGGNRCQRPTRLSLPARRRRRLGGRAESSAEPLHGAASGPREGLYGFSLTAATRAREDRVAAVAGMIIEFVEGGRSRAV